MSPTTQLVGLTLIKRLGACRRIAAVALSLLALALSIAAPGTIAHADDEIPVLRDSQLGSAVRVEVEPRCSEVQFRSPEVKIRWSVDSGAVEGLSGSDELVAATQYRLDTSRFHSGFDTGRFESVAVRTDTGEPGRGGEMKTSPANSAVVGVLEPGVYYYARVLVRTPDGWVPSSPIGFLSSVCPADGIDEE